MRALRRWPDDAAGSLALAMLVMIAGVGLSVVLMSSTLQVIRSTRVEATRTAALQGARAGIAGALANIRSAVDSAGMGLTANLPCGTGGPQVTGTVAAGQVVYKVSITYLTADPTTHDDAWITTNGKPCASDLSALPAYAYVKSTGTDTLTHETRTLFGIYAFRTVVNGTMPGGQLRVWHNSGDKYTLCIDAGVAPKAGDAVTMQPCATDSNGAVARQKFGYQPNLTMSLLSSLATTPLCLDAGSPQKAKQALKLQPCGTTGLFQQEWSFNYASGMLGTTNGVTVNNYCWSVKSPDTPGSAVTLNDTSGGNGNSACNSDYPNNFQSWNPTPDVGAGAAGLPNSKQLTNFEEFGRCLDITYEDVTKPYEVVFQCKQSPTPDLVNNWNQAWNLPPTGLGPVYVHSKADGRDYCLVMPHLAPGPDLVVVRSCVPLLPVADDEIWWVRGAATTTFDEAYRIEGVGDWAGQCLASLTDQIPWQQATKAGLLPCNGDDIQKWNVVSSLNPSGLSAIGER